MDSTTPPIISQLQSLLSQLQSIDLQDPDPNLSGRLSSLAAAATAAQTEISRVQAETPSQTRADEVPLGHGILLESSINEWSSSTSAPDSNSVHHSVAACMPSVSEMTADSNSESSLVHSALECAPHSSSVLQQSSGPNFPWIELPKESIPAPESTYAAHEETRQFGMPLSGVLPLAPPLHLFKWPTDSVSKLGRPELHQLVPPPSAPPPPFGQYPQAPTYTINSNIDLSYRRGYHYAAPYHTANRAIEHQRMLDVQVPPNLRPVGFNLDTQSFVYDPIPGMVQLPMGVPLVHHVNGDENRAVTAVCGHTLDSLMQYKEGEKVKALIPRLMTLTWGIEKTDTELGVPGIFELPGMQRNLRSKHREGSIPDGDGSFNLASTHGEGEGHGIFMPAIQTNTAQAAEIIREVLQILHQLYRLIMPLCVSRFEWDMLEFIGRENNVIAFGGFEPGPTSCQANSSSAVNEVDLEAQTANPPNPPTSTEILGRPSNSSTAGAQSEAGDSPPSPQNKPEKIVDLGTILLAYLEKSIGAQGAAHGDFKDDPIAFTLFALMFRLAPGSDLGPFLWMRGGIYLRELNVYILFTSFKAQDIHMGSAPTVVKQIQKAWISMDSANELFKRFGPQIRFGYVMYPSMAATARTTQIMYSPSLRFLHSPAPNTRDGYRKYYSAHGETVLGDSRARANRLGLEGILGLKNYFMQCKLNLGLNVNSLLEKATFTDEDGQIQSLEHTPIDVEDEQTYRLICLYRRYYFWWREVISDYALGVQKPQFKVWQQAIRDLYAGQGQHAKSLATEHRLLPQFHVRQSAPGSFPLIDRIISRRKQGSEAFWTLVIVGESQAQEVPEQATSWLNQGPNAQKCLEYISKYGMGPPTGVKTSATDDMVVDTAASLAQPTVLLTQSTDLMLVDSDSGTHAAQIGPHEPSDQAIQLSSITLDPLSTQPPTNSFTDETAAQSVETLKDSETLPTNTSDIPAVTGVVLTENSSSEKAATVLQVRKRKRKCVEIANFSDSDSDTDSTPKNEKSVSDKPQLNQEPSDTEYEIEKIVDVREEDGKRQWLVRWKGFGPDDDMWRDEDQLRLLNSASGKSAPVLWNISLKLWDGANPGAHHLTEVVGREAARRALVFSKIGSMRLIWTENISEAQDLVNEFNSQAQLPPALFLDPSSQPSEPDSDFMDASHQPTPSPDSDSDFEISKKPSAALTERAKRYLRFLDPDTTSKRPLKTDELKEELLCALLDPERLAAEGNDIALASASLQNPADFRLASESPSSLAGRIVDQIERNNELSTQMYFELPSGTSSTWGPRLANLTLSCITNVGLTIPDMITQEHIHDIISRGVQAQICRSLVAIYQWIVHLGPSLAEQLISIHQSDGPHVLTQKFPSLAPIVVHVVSFVQHHCKQQADAAAAKAKVRAERKAARAGQSAPQARGRPKRRKIGVSNNTPTEVGNPTEHQTEAGPANSEATNWSHIPGNLFGLLPTTKTTITLEALGEKVKIQSDEDVYRISIKYLCKIWEDHLILKPMAKVDQYLNPNERPTRSRAFMESVRDRCITRGAILQCIAENFGDGVFASKGIKTFLLRPSRMFSSAIERDEHFARSIENDEQETLNVVNAWLAGCYIEHPELEPLCARLGELVHRGLLSLTLGQPLTDEEYENPDQLTSSRHSLSKLTKATGSRKKSRCKPTTDVQPSIATLLLNKPLFGIPAIIVREALSRRRQKPVTKETSIFRRMLDGEHPTTGAATRRDPDQMNPVRADLQGLRLLHRVIPAKLFTTKTGLSSLLVFMGTGQGTMTSEFLARMELKPNKLHFLTLAECIEQFTSLELYNRNSDPTAQLKYENTAIYGQSNTWYSSRPWVQIDRKWVQLTLAEKFEPYFCDEIQRSWEAFLGPLANQDPATSDCLRRSWEEVLHWIVQSGLRGFGSGLGALQFANNMVLSGVAEAPSPATMAQWIWANKDYGAFAGLCVLGFNLPRNTSPAAVRAAFFCFYYWLEHHLTKEDKLMLDFGTLFVEQLLCKVGRWKNRMQTMGKIDLVEEARKLFEGKEWRQGDNLQNHTAFPIPSCESFPLSVFQGIVEHGSEHLQINIETEIEM